MGIYGFSWKVPGKPGWGLWNTKVKRLRKYVDLLSLSILSATTLFIQPFSLQENRPWLMRKSFIKERKDYASTFCSMSWGKTSPKYSPCISNCQSHSWEASKKNRGLHGHIITQSTRLKAIPTSGFNTNIFPDTGKAQKNRHATWKLDREWIQRASNWDLDKAGESKNGKSRNTKKKEGIAAVMIGLEKKKTRWKEFGR